MSHKVALFGEAEKGNFRSLLHFTALPAMADTLGNPPDGSIGIHLAIQTLLFRYDLLFVRVEEEGFSHKDYHNGFKLLKRSEKAKKLSAICIPGVGDYDLIQQASELCYRHQSILITTERDFYDYLTCFCNEA
ncbi:hypothetical protein COB11_02120 [Candidatus Aerophobetes bacterium]|uniref:Uncharacterized protein n=1 Tax=Aerophobetes bacterium TaxID=2030807 RepID=A0A2A4YL53_UNCAE|nr:MAG: hypothetical protein COB11_02120 [Candidatus Aerophobetes bacterium]